MYYLTMTNVRAAIIRATTRSDPQATATTPKTVMLTAPVK